MGFEKRRFFDAVRSDVFEGRIRAAQVAGTELILDRFEVLLPGGDQRWMAYMLATAFHETAGTMQPVRETLAGTDDAAIAILERAYAAGRLPAVTKPYWRRDDDGKSWLGRGLVQLTHRRNYEAMSVLTGIDLVERPERAMEPEMATTILIRGMTAGSFTGRRLSGFFGRGREDWQGARAIINGNDRAALVAEYAHAFHRSLEAARIE